MLHILSKENWTIFASFLSIIAADTYPAPIIPEEHLQVVDLAFHGLLKPYDEVNIVTDHSDESEDPDCRAYDICSRTKERIRDGDSSLAPWTLACVS